MYSFGCILYELWTGHVPHAEMADPVAFGEAIKTVRIWRIRRGPARWVTKCYCLLQGYRPGIPASVPVGWRDLIASCLRQDPAHRPHFKDILQLMDGLQGAKRIPTTVAGNYAIVHPMLFVCS